MRPTGAHVIADEVARKKTSRRRAKHVRLQCSRTMFSEAEAENNMAVGANVCWTFASVPYIAENHPIVIELISQPRNRAVSTGQSNG